MATDYLTLTREQLYALVWSKPVSELAKDFGISDVAVAKRLRKLRVPVPGRGYWARVYAGQAPVQILLPEKPQERADYSALAFSAPPEPEPPTEAEAAELDAQSSKIRQLQIAPVKDLTSIHLAVRRTALDLKRPWRGNIRWKRNDREGPSFKIDVSDAVQDRALILADSFLRAAAELGWLFVAQPVTQDNNRQRYSLPETKPDPRPYGVLDVVGEKMNVFIDERSHRVPHVLTDKERLEQRLRQYSFAPKWDYKNRGELRMHIGSVECSYLTKTFNDSNTSKLEDKIADVLMACWEQSKELKQRREEARLREIERRQEELRELRTQERCNAHYKLSYELERQAGAWHRARFLRRYLRAAKRAVSDRKISARFLDEQIDFIAWAESYVEQLDPLTVTPRNLELDVSSSYHTPTEQQLEAMLLRLTGGEWKWSAKLVLCGTQDCIDSQEDDD